MAPFDQLDVELSECGQYFHGEIHGNGHISTSAAQLDFTTKFHERRIISEDKRLSTVWKWPVTDVTALIIKNCWPQDQLCVTEEARIMLDSLLIQEQYLQAKLENLSKFANDKTVISDGLILNKKYPLKPYQIVALKNSMGTPGYGLFMEQGTGKSAVVVARVCNEAIRYSRPYTVIIICPNNVRSNWVCEFDKFATCQGTVQVIKGGRIKRREEALKGLRANEGDQYKVLVVGYDLLQQFYDMVKIGVFDLGVADESQYIKTPESNRSKEAKKISLICKHRMCLTGTPITNSVLDMYAQFEFLGKGFSGFYKWKNFKKFYGKYRKDEAGFDKLVAVQRLPFMKHRLAKLSYAVTKKEALPDLPDKVYDIHEVEMSLQQQKAYNDLCEHLITLIESDFAKGGSTAVTAEHVLKRMLKLAEITSGFLKVAPEYSPEGVEITPSHIVEFDRNPKLEALVDILKNKEINEKTIVWACFVHDVEAIASRLQNEGIRAVNYYGKTSHTQRELAVKNFNCDPSIKVFVGNPQACGTGVNLLGFDPELPDDYDTNADHAIIYSQNWQPSTRWQCEDRNHRLGIRTKIRYTDLCVMGTIDEEIRDRVSDKKLSAMQITEDVKEIIKRVLRHA